MANQNSDSKSNKQKAAKIKKIISTTIVIIICLYWVYLRFQEMQNGTSENTGTANTTVSQESGAKGGDYSLPEGFSLDDVPYYYGDAVIKINGNKPFFTQSEIDWAKNKGAFEYYGKLDSLGRCTIAYDCVGKETMPARGEKRGDISSIHPSGWHQARYDCVDSETVMTRAHLAGFMLSAENANAQNLITGTRYLNSDAMLPYEEEVANWLDYHKDKHVLYRVTPWFNGNDLMADGILMEAYSLEDNGASIQYCVYVYNVQPGVKFNYSTGYSQYSGIFFDTKGESIITDGISLKGFGINLETNTIHEKSCQAYKSLNSSDKSEFMGDKAMVKQWPNMGYKLCSECMK